MTSSIAAVIGGTEIYWAGIVIAFGAVAGFLFAYALYTAHSGRGGGMWVMFGISLVLALLFSRLVHFWFSREQYDGFLSALTDFSLGSFWLPGAVLALVPAAHLVERMGFPDDPGELLDAFAPGAAFTIAMTRLSALFGTTCRSMYRVTPQLLRRYPFACPPDAGTESTSWHFAPFFMMAVLMMLVMLFMFFFYLGHHADRMEKPCSRSGNVARLTLALYCAVEFVVDSTRNDSMTLHFRILRFLNPRRTVISFTQLCALVGLLLVMFYYVRNSVAAKGKTGRTTALGALFAASLIGACLTEIFVQRYTGHALLLTLLQSLFAALMVTAVFLTAFSCREQHPPEEPEEAEE